MLSWDNQIRGSEGNSVRRCRAICCGLHRCFSPSRQHGMQERVGVGPPPAGTRPRPHCVPMCFERPVPGTVGGCRGSDRATQLPRIRRGMPAELRSDRTDAHSALTQIGDQNPLIQRQVPAADLFHLEAVQRIDESHHRSSPAHLVTAGPVRAGRARDPCLAARRGHRPAPAAQLHEPFPLGRLRTPARTLLHTTNRYQHNPRISGCCDRTWKLPG